MKTSSFLISLRTAWLFCLILAICACVWMPLSGAAGESGTPADLPLISPSPTLTPTLTPTTTLPPTTEPCGYQWASQALPVETEVLAAALTAAGVEIGFARAEAFGENCVTASGKIASFAIMYTDFRLQLSVVDLADEHALGQKVESVLAVLASFPPETFPGPNRGYLGIQFRQGEQTRNLWVRVDEAQRALDEGLRGANLLNRLAPLR